MLAMTWFGGRHSAARAALAAAVAFGAGVVPAGALGAAGFTAPQRLSATADWVDLDDIAVAPTGRTAVMWRTADEGKRAKDWRYGEWVALGPDAAHLGQQTKLAVPTAYARDAFYKSLDAFPDGSFVACMQTDPRKGDAVAGCTFATPDGGFGPLREFNRVSWKVRPTFEAFARPDGRVLLITTQLAKGKKRTVSTRLLDRDGHATTPQFLASVPTTRGVTVAATTDGLVAATWSPTDSIEGEPVSDQQLALLAPGAERFGSPRPLALPEATTVTLTGGRRIVLGSRTYYRERPIERFATVSADGALSPFVETRRFTKKGGLYTTVLPLLDGSLFGVSQSFLSAPLDCDTHPFSEIGVGGLAPSTGTAVTGTRLSTPGQIAEYPSAVELADGTVIVGWGNASREGAEYRLETAVRAPGAQQFSAPQVLPGAVSNWWTFRGGGNEALFVAKVAEGQPWESPQHLVVSAYTRSGPVAKAGKRPRHPSTSCG